jgi:hypothetical protein
MLLCDKRGVRFAFPQTSDRKTYVSKYFVHIPRKHKKIKEFASNEAIDVESRQREIETQRKRERLQLEQARAEKETRMLIRAAMKRASLTHDASGRRRTATRTAGFVLVSATAGLRTHGISLCRKPGSAADDLWRTMIKFQNELALNYYINDVATPLDVDAIHAMRALAPQTAEQLFMGVAFCDGADANNLLTAHRLVESYLRKSQNISSLTDSEKRALRLTIFGEFNRIVTQRLRCLGNELGRIVDALMHVTELSRSDCNALLGSVYERFHEFCCMEAKSHLFRQPSQTAFGAKRLQPTARFSDCSCDSTSEVRSEWLAPLAPSPFSCEGENFFRAEGRPKLGGYLQRNLK